jgi:2-dehydropantoate 2-reductase
VHDIVRANCEKFVLLVGMSSATAVTRKPIATVRADADIRWLFEQTMREIWRLARKRGIELPADFVEERLAYAATMPTELRSSMAHDLD